MRRILYRLRNRWWIVGLRGYGETLHIIPVKRIFRPRWRVAFASGPFGPEEFANAHECTCRLMACCIECHVKACHCCDHPPQTEGADQGRKGQKTAGGKFTRKSG